MFGNITESQKKKTLIILFIIFPIVLISSFILVVLFAQGIGVNLSFKKYVYILIMMTLLGYPALCLGILFGLLRSTKLKKKNI